MLHWLLIIDRSHQLQVAVGVWGLLRDSAVSAPSLALSRAGCAEPDTTDTSVPLPSSPC